MNVAKPRYQQLKDLIIERISSGELKPSDRVPSPAPARSRSTCA